MRSPAGAARAAALAAALAAASCAAPGPAPAPAASGAVLFREDFDDAELVRRGFYDGDRFVLATVGGADGSCLEYRWREGGTRPDGSSGVRRTFAPSDSVYVRFRLRLDPDWQWTGRPYHPHLVHFLTTENGPYHGPAASRLTLYVEPWDGRLRLAAQDIENADAPHGLTQGPLRGGFNGTFFDSPRAVFVPGRWHVVEALFRLNDLDLARDVPVANGVARGWVDGALVVDRDDVVLRSTDHPRMRFDQFLLLPWFGPGLLPRAQALWIDDLVVARQRVP